MWTFFNILSTVSAIVISLAIFYKPFRWYLMSWHFNWLYRHPKVAKFLGMKFVDINTSRDAKRRHSHVFMTGIVVKFFQWYTGLSVIPSQEHRVDLIKLQGAHHNEMSLERYFNSWKDGETINIIELENRLSDMILEETNRVFKVFSTDAEYQKFRSYLRLLRYIIAGLTGGEIRLFGALKSHWRDLWGLRKMLWSIPDIKRTLLTAPQLTFVNGFVQMIILRESLQENGRFKLKDGLDETRKLDFKGVQAYEFLVPSAEYIVFVIDGVLTFEGNRKVVEDNTSNNTNFGPPGFQCPGKLFTMTSIKSIVEFFSSMEYTVKGIPVLTTGRYRDILNKKDITVTFYKTKEYSQPDAEQFKAEDYEDMRAD